MRLLSAITIFMTLGACASAGPDAYGPADGDGFGYAEQAIENDRYRVVYRGSAGSSPERVEDLALRRAAELTLENGFDWFRVAGRAVSGEERGGVSVGAGLGSGGSVGRRSSVGVGVGGDLGRFGSREYFTVRLEVLMSAGAAPTDVDAYDARGVLSRLGEAR